MFSGEIAQLFVVYLKKRFPYHSRFNHTPDEWSTIKRKYAKWRWITVIIMFVFICSLPLIYAWVLHHFFFALMSLVIRQPNLLFLPGIEVFLIPGLILTLSTIGYPIEWLQRYFMGADGYMVFEDYYNTKEQYDNHEATIWIQKLLRIPFIIALLIAMTTGIAISPSHVIVRKIFGLPHTYPYNDVKKVTFFSFFRNDEGVETFSPHYKIVFKDNYSITTSGFFDSLSSTQPLIRSLHNSIDTARVDTD